MKPIQHPVWQTLISHQQSLSRIHLADFFKREPNRFSDMSVRIPELTFDYSKQHLTQKTIDLFTDLLRDLDFHAEMDGLFSGAIVNPSEHQGAFHGALRGSYISPLSPDLPSLQMINQTLQKMKSFCDGFNTSMDQPITDIIHVGIGGSVLGPAFIIDALAHIPVPDHAPRIHFISNVDGHPLHHLLQKLSPHQTGVIIASKTFTTDETLTNARTILGWFEESGFSKSDIQKRLFGVTACPHIAHDFGIHDDHIFPFPPEIGGRYSLWSSVGLPIALRYGFPIFNDLLVGAHDADRHFQRTEFNQNIPVLMAIISVWNTVFWGRSSQAIIPYDQRLNLLPTYLQQLIMESLGKSYDRDGDPLQVPSCGIIWGGTGTDAQHSFFQLLHQGTHIIPLELIACVQADHTYPLHHQKLLANALAQSESLMNGNGTPVFPGNRPSTSILLERLNPHTLGLLLAFYEHRVFTESFLLHLYAFDQPGVELGKQCARALLSEWQRNAESLHDSSTTGLLQIILGDRMT